jgi:hypothetical protein
MGPLNVLSAIAVHEPVKAPLGLHDLRGGSQIPLLMAAQPAAVSGAEVPMTGQIYDGAGIHPAARHTSGTSCEWAGNANGGQPGDGRNGCWIAALDERKSR